MSFFERGNSVTTLELSLMEAVFEVWSMLMSPSRRVCPTTWRLDVGPPTPTPTPRLPVVVSMTVLDEAPTKVTLSTLLKSSVPWGVAIGIVSTIWGGFFKLGKANGFCLIRNSFSYKVEGTLEENIYTESSITGGVYSKTSCRLVAPAGIVPFSR